MNEKKEVDARKACPDARFLNPLLTNPGARDNFNPSLSFPFHFICDTEFTPWSHGQFVMICITGSVSRFMQFLRTILRLGSS